MSAAASEAPPRGIWEIPGQPRAVEVLQRAVATGELGHAWAFTGPEGVGQEHAARSLTAALVCPHEPAGCGACHPCQRALAGTHPALQAFAPTGAMHRVEDVRTRWLPAASLSAGEGGWKVLHVRLADRMNLAAANAFLKGLEEPPPRTVWLLDLADPDALPETILSRCRPLRFAALDAATLADLAADLPFDDEGDRALAVRACLGSPARLAELADGGLAALRAHRAVPRRMRAETQAVAIEEAFAIEQRAEARAKAAAKDLADQRDELKELHGGTLPRELTAEFESAENRRKRDARTAVVRGALDDLASWYRDVLLVGTGGDPAEAVHADDPEGLAADAAAIPPAALLAGLDAILTTREALAANAQPRLAVEALLMGLAADALGR